LIKTNNLALNKRSWFQRTFNPIKKASHTTFTLSELQTHFLEVLQSRGVTPREAIEKSEWVYACCKAICQKISSIPFRIMNGDKEDFKAKEFILNSNQYFLFTEMVSQVQSWIELRGYGVWHYKDFLEVYDSDKFIIETNNGIVSYRYDSKPVPSEEIVIVRNFSPYARLSGLSTIQAGLGELRMMENVQGVTSKFFEKGAFLSGIISTNEKLETEEVDLIKDLMEEYQGTKNAGDIAVLHSGLHFEKIGLSPGDFDLLQYKDITKASIESIFGVPGVIITDMQKADYANAKKQEEIFTRYTIIPKLNYNEGFYTRFLLPMLGLQGRTFEYLWQSLPELQIDMLVKAQSEEIQVRTGTRLINELRTLDGLEPTDYGDQFYMNAMLSPMGGLKPQKSIKSIMERIIELKTIDTVKKKSKSEITMAKNEVISKAYNNRYSTQIKRLKSEMEKFYDRLLKDIKETYPEDLTKFEINDKWKEHLQKSLKPFYEAFAQQAGDFIWDLYELKNYWKTQSVEKEFELRDQNLQSVLNDLTVKLSENVYGTMTDEVERTAGRLIREGKEQGLGTGTIYSNLMNSFTEQFTQQKGYWAERVARTEVLKINSNAGIQSAKQGDMNTKSWLPSGSSNGRPEHQAMDPDEFIDIDEAFSNGLMYPGDGDAFDSCNCGCGLLFGWKIGEKPVEDDIYDNLSNGAEHEYVNPDWIQNNEYEINLYAESHGLDPDAFKELLKNKLDALVKFSKTCVRVDQYNLDKIYKDGKIKSQFETDTSSGILDPDERYKFEQNVFGYKEGAERPIYGYLVDDPTKKYQSLEGYGDTIIILRDTMRNKTTFIFGDTYDLYGTNRSFTPSKLTNPNMKCIPLENESIENVKKILDRILNSKSMNPNIAGKDLYYVEAQYHGGVSTKDIKRIYFPDDYSEDTVNNFKKLGIECYTRKGKKL